MKRMTDCLAHARNLLDEGLKNLCGRLSPDRRFAVILALGMLLAVVNFWVLFRAVYSIGREEVLQELLELQEMPKLQEMQEMPKLQELQEMPMLQELQEMQEMPMLQELPEFPPLQIPGYMPQDTLHDAIRRQMPDISDDAQSPESHDDE